MTKALFAQLATVRERRLIAGRTVDLIAGRAARLADNVPLEGVFRFGGGGQTLDSRTGARTAASHKDFDEFDGEGVAWSSTASGGVFYVVGSHSCGREHNTRRRSTHLLARFRVDGNGAVERAGGADLATWVRR